VAEPRISGAESLVMQALWARGPMGADELLAEVGQGQGWGESTLRTLIHRLARKGALKAERRGGRTAYVPLVSREAYVTAESQGLLDRLFGGQLAALVAHFTQQAALSPEEVARLKRLVAELDAEEE
jgi:BlaI family transcriptional regulator, penicillinase repressor